MIILNIALPSSNASQGNPRLQGEEAAEELLGEAEIRLRRAVRKTVQKEIAPRARVVDSHGAFPKQSYRSLVDAGLTGLTFPKELGGKGHSTLAYAVVIEEISAACGSTSLVYMTQTHCAYPIFVAASDYQKQRFLPALFDGRMYGSLAITEPDSGSDIASIRTMASRDGDHYVLNGTKTFVTNGDRASVIVLFALLDSSHGREGITAFIAEKPNAGVRTGRTFSKMGMCGSSTVELFFDDFRMPVAHRLGREREGYAIAIRSIVRSRISAAAQGLGLARGAYELTLRWAHDKGFFTSGRRDAQDVLFVLADMRTRLSAARLLLYQTARLVDKEKIEPTVEVSMAKLHCTDLAMALSSEAVDLVGEDGDLEELEIERYMRDAKVTQIYEGTNQIQRILIARSLQLIPDTN